jgi:hypothetical protein
MILLDLGCRLWRTGVFSLLGLKTRAGTQGACWDSRRVLGLETRAGTRDACFFTSVPVNSHGAGALISAGSELVAGNRLTPMI